MSRETRIARLEALVDDIQTSIGNLDWDGAENQILQAQALLAFIPDMNRGTGGVRWRDELDRLRQVVQRKRTSRIQTVKFKHCGPTAGDTSTEDAAIATSYLSKQGIAYTS